MLPFLIARLSSSLPCRKTTHLGFLHRSASHIFNSFSSVVKLSESNQPKQKLEGNESFTVSYLKNSCGLSAEIATQISKRVILKGLDNPDSVVNLFRRYGFSETQISKIVKNIPRVLLAKPEKTLLPKLRFFQSTGLSGSELTELVAANPFFLAVSLEKHIIPRYEALKSVLDPDEKVNITLKRSGRNFFHHDVTNLVPNIKVLRAHGVPQSSITLLVTRFSSIAFMNHAKFVGTVKFAKEAGVNPFRVMFIRALYVSSITKKSTWDSKLDIFERCGWARDVTLMAFRNYPYCMLQSEEKIIKVMKFVVDEMGLPFENIARWPVFLGCSLNQRVIPRWSVVKILKMKGLIKKNMSPISIFKLSKKKFEEEFVIRFQESVPELLNIYKGYVPPLPEVQ